MLARSPYREGEQIRFNIGTEEAPEYVSARIDNLSPAYHKKENIDILRFNLPGDSPGTIKYTILYSDDSRISKMPVEPSKLEKMLASLTAKMPKILARKEAQVELAPAYD